MTWKPSKPFTTVTANARVRQLHPGAFCKVARDSLRGLRFQVLLEQDGATYMVSAGPSWVKALTQFYEFMEAADGEGKDGNPHPETGGGGAEASAGNGGAEGVP